MFEESEKCQSVIFDSCHKSNSIVRNTKDFNAKSFKSQRSILDVLIESPGMSKTFAIPTLLIIFRTVKACQQLTSKLKHLKRLKGQLNSFNFGNVLYFHLRQERIFLEARIVKMTFDSSCLRFAIFL